MQYGKAWMENGAYPMGPLAAAVPVISGGLSILGAAKSLFGGGNKESAPPPVAPPVPMPDADSQKVAAARRRSTVEQMQRQGRESTILTQATDEKLGG